MAQETKDWDLHPEKYLTEEDGVTFKLTKAGLPRKKGGRPKGKTSNYNYSSSTKAICVIIINYYYFRFMANLSLIYL